MFQTTLKIFASATFCLFSGGCSGFSTMRSDGTIVRHYFGYVRVVTPPHASSEGRFDVMEITGIGIRIHRGAGLGYFHERDEFIPLDSRLVVRVQNKEQMNKVLETLTPIVKEGLCVTVDRH